MIGEKRPGSVPPFRKWGSVCACALWKVAGPRQPAEGQGFLASTRVDEAKPKRRSGGRVSSFLPWRIVCAGQCKLPQPQSQYRFGAAALPSDFSSSCVIGDDLGGQQVFVGASVLLLRLCLLLPLILPNSCQPRLVGTGKVFPSEVCFLFVLGEPPGDGLIERVSQGSGWVELTSRADGR